MKYKIGVFGSAIGEHSEEEKASAFLLGKLIAQGGCVLVTGATFGLPDEAVKGAKSMEGTTLGISPAYSEEDHKKMGLPLNDTLVVYTGLGYQGRNMINIRSSDACVFLKGSIGTLNEFTLAVKEEKVIGILESSGGVSGRLRDLLDGLKLNFNPKIIYSNNEKELIERVIDELKNRLEE